MVAQAVARRARGRDLVHAGVGAAAIARGIDAQGHAHDSNFLPANREVLGDSLKPREMIELCLEENAERMSGYDARLLRLPALARFALRFIKP